MKQILLGATRKRVPSFCRSGLTVKIVGHERIMAFEKDEKASDKHPDFKCDGVAVWARPCLVRPVLPSRDIENHEFA